MIRVILFCTAVTSASVGGDNNTDNNTTNNLAEREILEFYPDWVPFKNKHGDEVGEFIDVSKPKAKVKKRLALPMNFLIKSVSDDDSDYYTGQGESDDNYDDKKEWSELHSSVYNASEPHNEKQQDKVSDIDGVVNIITQTPPALADDINKSIQKEDEHQEEPPQKKEYGKEHVLTPKPNERVYIEEEDDPERKNNQQLSQDESQKLSTEEQKENEAKKRLILDSVDQLNIRHEEEQRAIAEKNKQNEYDNEFRHRKTKNKLKRVKPTPPNYDEYEDMSWNNKYKINVEKKPADERPDLTVWEVITDKPKTTAMYKPVDRSRNKYSLFRNPSLFTIDEDEEEKNPAKKISNGPRRFSSKYSAKNFITPGTTTEEIEPILYFPKRTQRRTKGRTTTPAPDSSVAENVEDKLIKRTNQRITYPDTSLGNDVNVTSTLPLWKADVTSLDSTESTVITPQDTIPPYDITAADITAPSGEAQANNSDTVTDAVPAFSDHKKKEGPKDYHVEKGSVGMERWVGQTAVVTGAGSGIGAASAAALASAGLRVIAVDITTEEAINDYLTPLLKPETQKNVIPKQVDVTDHQQLEELFRWLDKFGGVSVLVSCAGVMYPGQVTDVGNNVVSAERLSRTLDVNTKGVILCAKFAVASMKKRGINGHIVNINSLAGHYVPFNSHMNVYSASKHAITAFNGLLSQELADFNSKIKLTSISPGNTMTELAGKSLEHVSKEPQVALQPSDVADAVLYALSTPPNININELTITSVGEKRL